MIIEVKKDPRYRIKTRFIKKTAQDLLKDFQWETEPELGVVLVGRRQARKLNLEYRHQSYTPAVLSFPYQERTPEKKFFLGEIIICFPLLREKALLENQTLEKALEDLLKHGINNLIKNSQGEI